MGCGSEVITGVLDPLTAGSEVIIGVLDLLTAGSVH